MSSCRDVATALVSWGLEPPSSLPDSLFTLTTGLVKASLEAFWGVQEYNWGARARFLEPPVADSVTYLRTGARRGSQRWGCEWLSELPFQSAQACGLWGPLPGQRLPGWGAQGAP